MRKNQTLPTIGFIGTGAITTALVTGLCRRRRSRCCGVSFHAVHGTEHNHV